MQQLPTAGLAHQVDQAVGRHAVAQAFEPDIGDAVAIRIVQADLGCVSEIQAQAVGGAEAGAFADQDHRHLGAEPLRHFIGDGHPALFHQNDWRHRPAFSRDLFFQSRQKRQGMAMYRQRRQAVSHDDGPMPPKQIGVLGAAFLGLTFFYDDDFAVPAAILFCLGIGYLAATALLWHFGWRLYAGTGLVVAVVLYRLARRVGRRLRSDTSR